MSEDAHTHRVLGGYKATLSNPNTSQDAKEHAQQMIDEMTGRSQKPGHNKRKDVDHEKGEHETNDTHLHRVIGGYKATLSNPNTSSQAKEHAQAKIEELEKSDYSGVGNGIVIGSKGKHDHETDDEHAHRIIGGHKANLQNPRTSEASKQHSREILAEYGIEQTFPAA